MEHPPAYNDTDGEKPSTPPGQAPPPPTSSTANDHGVSTLSQASTGPSFVAPAPPDGAAPSVPIDQLLAQDVEKKWSCDHWLRKSCHIIIFSVLAAVFCVGIIEGGEHLQLYQEYPNEGDCTIKRIRLLEITNPILVCDDWDATETYYLVNYTIALNEDCINNNENVLYKRGTKKCTTDVSEYQDWQTNDNIECYYNDNCNDFTIDISSDYIIFYNVCLFGVLPLLIIYICILIAHFLHKLPDRGEAILCCKTIAQLHKEREDAKLLKEAIKQAKEKKKQKK